MLAAQLLPFRPRNRTRSWRVVERCRTGRNSVGENHPGHSCNVSTALFPSRSSLDTWTRPPPPGCYRRKWPKMAEMAENGPKRGPHYRCLVGANELTLHSEGVTFDWRAPMGTSLSDSTSLVVRQHIDPTATAFRGLYHFYKLVILDTPRSQ